MSNPLLNPNDPRFRKPQLGGPGAENPFSEKAPSAQAPTESSPRDLYSATSDDPRPYTPQYAAQQRPRYQLLFILGGLGWGAAVIGAVSMTGIFEIGWMAPLLGAGPAAAGWLLAHEDLKAIRLGAIPSAAHPPTRHAFWLGLTGLIACLGVVAGMVAQQMHALPDV
jgi:hypothetical protein